MALQFPLNRTSVFSVVAWSISSSLFPPSVWVSEIPQISRSTSLRLNAAVLLSFILPAITATLIKFFRFCPALFYRYELLPVSVSTWSRTALLNTEAMMPKNSF